MTHHLQTPDAATTATAATTVDAARSAAPLRRLYAARAAFAVVWAALFAVTASGLGPVSVALLLLYPLVDLAAAVVDLRSSGAGRSRGPLRLNAVLSLLAVVALGVAAASGIPAVLRVWGAWAVVSGVVQVVVAVRRRGVGGLGGQWALVLSGAISVLAGSGFVLVAAGSDPSLTGLAGYALLGGVFFLVSAIGLHRAVPTNDR